MGLTCDLASSHSHTLSAAIVIYSYIFHLIDTNAPISEIAREK